MVNSDILGAENKTEDESRELRIISDKYYGI
jgi:hypothetical protein